MEEQEEVMRQGNISLVLDSYDDLFSDFDPRSYSEKALSDDFLVECKRASLDKDGNIELRLLVPEKKRDLLSENKIKKRLKSHFSKHYHEKRKHIKKTKLTGLVWFLLGGLIMIGATFLYVRENNFFMNLLLVMSEPAGWFFFWEGLDQIYLYSREQKPDYDFYSKMSEANIIFASY